MLLVAGPGRPKRVGQHHVYTTSNPHGEWSIFVDPGGLLIDNYHSKGGTAHLHPPRAYDKTIELPGLESSRARAVLRAHLETHREIKLKKLLQGLCDS